MLHIPIVILTNNTSVSLHLFQENILVCHGIPKHTHIHGESSDKFVYLLVNVLETNVVYIHTIWLVVCVCAITPLYIRVWGVCTWCRCSLSVAQWPEAWPWGDLQRYTRSIGRQHLYCLADQTYRLFYFTMQNTYTASCHLGASD